jgi:vancomycin resistance protein YoaR
MGLPLPHAHFKRRSDKYQSGFKHKETDLIYSKLLELKKGVDKPATDARVIYDKGYLEYIVHENGTTLDVMATMKKIGQALRKVLWVRLR